MGRTDSRIGSAILIPAMFSESERAYVETARVARLATADADGRPHAVPICFALVGDHLVSPIDEKPKERPPSTLRRVRDVRDNPAVTVLVDHYVENWERLGWVQVRGSGTLLEVAAGTDSAPIERSRAIEALRVKYEQYAEHDLERRPLILVSPGSVTSWGSIQAPNDA